MSATRPVIAIYPGSFDPITLGHEDIARRTLQIADRLIIAVAYTATQTKKSLFSIDERVELIRGAPVPTPTPSASGKGQVLVRCPKCQIALWSLRQQRGRVGFAIVQAHG